jgi:hypothetical protein
MKALLNFLQSLAGIETDAGLSRTLETIAFTFLALMVGFAPHSIAATQSAWLIGMTAWIARLFIKPSSPIRVTTVGLALVAFFAWSVLSSILSYEPAISLDRLRGASTFLIFIYALNVIRNRRAVIFLAFALIASSMLSVISAPIQKLIGRGVEVAGVAADGPLGALGVVDGDTIVRVDGRKISEPREVVSALDQARTIRITLYRPDYEFSIELDRSVLNEASDPPTALGFSSWKASRKFRAAGFYGHYATFAEVLQLIGALAFGLFLAAFTSRQQLRSVVSLGICIAGIALALLFTVTRASQLAFMISSMASLILGSSRRFVLIASLIAVPLAAAGLFYLQQQRQVGFFDSKDGSIQWRQMMWRDGLRLLQESPRHLLVGVGMDSIKNRWAEWGFFDKGWQPMGHFHSTPMQIAVERGIPALLIWLIALGLYARTLWRGLKRASLGDDWRSRGVLLGCMAALIGFFASGLVHSNLSDQEVAMVFFILMAFGVKLSDLPPADDLLLKDAVIFQPRA